MPYFVESFEGLSRNGPVDDTVCHILLWTIFRRYRRRAYDISGQPYNENVGANEAAHREDS